MKVQQIIFAFIFFCMYSCKEQAAKQGSQQFVVITGVAQDAGYPQLGCTKECCAAYYAGKAEKKHVVSLALIDQASQQYSLFEATPDITAQIQLIQPHLSKANNQPAGVFLTHAHFGHYTGLMYFGREAMNANKVPVYTLPRLDSFLRSNGPWNQLVSLQNISLQPMKADSTISINNHISVTAIQVPHRDEFSETAGFIIQTKQKKLLFIPDIDKWNKWERSIADLIKTVDYALLDATFYKNGELPNRNMSDIPHPFVEESMELFRNIDADQKKQIVFIHFNHTNPMLQKNSEAVQEVKANGFKVAEEGLVLNM